MAIQAIIGGQWGDEGKGKIVDLLSKNANIVARYQGGANAGHTIYKAGQKIVLHQIPAGAIRKQCLCVLGRGMVIDPIGILEEINLLEKHNINVDNRLFIDNYAHIVTPIHKLIDKTNEIKSGNEIGTTCKGIGPTYTDKYERIGIRAIDLLSPEILDNKIQTRLDIAIKKDEINSSDLNQLKVDLKIYYDCIQKMKIYIKDTFPLFHDNIQSNILIEGAQGTMLDIDFGTFPYVTSSNCSSGGIATGLGIPGNKIQYILGIFKAYTTRVGGGPFPTELFDEDGKKMAKIGHEFGATTGRSRRCGWFDLLVAKYSVQLNGFTNIALTKLDILDSFETIKVCIGYEINGKKINNISEVLNNLDHVSPIYKEFEGWQCNIESISSFDALPDNAKLYIKFLSDFLQVPITIISIGPKRNQIIFN